VEIAEIDLLIENLTLAAEGENDALLVPYVDR
jgi:hypothetical protein